MTRQRRRGLNRFRPLVHLWLILNMFFSQGTGPAQFVRDAAQLAGPFVVRGAGVAAGVFAAAALFADARAANGTASPSDSQIPNVKAALQSAPVLFVQNVGQYDSAAHFQAHTANGTVWLADNAIWITALEPPKSSPPPRDQPLSHQQSTPAASNGVHLKLSFVGANPHPRIEPFDRLTTHVSYFVGSDPAKWHADVPVWGGVRYVDLYPGIDLELTGIGGQWSPRFITHSGADPSAVRLRIEGANSTRVNGDHLDVATSIGTLRIPGFSPAAIQGATASGTPSQLATIASRVTDLFSVRQALAAPLSSDTNTLTYSTYLGSTAGNSGYGIAVDSSGDAYVTGFAYGGSDFPTTPGAFQTTIQSGEPSYVTKFNATGTGLIYSTYLGGTTGANDADHGGIAVDANGDAFVTGETGASDFPTTPGSAFPTYNGDSDVFVTKLNPTGTALVYSTFLGGTIQEFSYGIAIDGSGAAYVTGETNSTNFPTTTGAFSRTFSGGNDDVFVSKLNPAGSALVYSTYLGGASDDAGYAVTVDGNGNAAVTGSTQSTNFPTSPGALVSSLRGSESAFVTEVNATGASLVFSTYLNGSVGAPWAEGIGVAVDRQGYVYVTGDTNATDFPTTPGAFSTTLNDGIDAFVTKLNPTGSSLAYGTFLGGGTPYAIALDASGAAYVAGDTASLDFPTTPNAFSTTYDNEYGCSNCGDAFFLELDPNGATLTYSTYIGGGGTDYAKGIALDSLNSAYVTGPTSSPTYLGPPDYPTTPGAFQGPTQGSSAFVSKFRPNPLVLPTESVSPPTKSIGLTYKGSGGDPVDTASGMYSYRKVDLAIPGRGPSPTFVRAYNSADSIVGPLGPGWTHSYQSRIVSDGNGNTVVVNPDGRRDVYTPLGNGAFSAPPAVPDVLTQDLRSGNYTLLHQDQSAWIYDGNGHLTSIKDRYGNQSTLTYNANNQLISVSDPAGRGSLTLAYDTCYNGRLCSVTDWQSPARSVQFTYDSAGRLWKVTDRNGQVTTYGYDGTSSNLTTITDANNHVAITNTYDSQGRVIAQKDALGITTSQQTTFSYVTNGDGSETTTVTKPTTSFDSNWQPQEVDSYDPQGRRTQRISKPTSTETDTITATYDSNYFTTSTTDARTNTTSYCYDVDYTGATISGNRGNLTRVISPPPINGQNPLVTLSKYDSKNNLIETIPPKGVNNGAIVSCTTDLSASLNLTYATDNTYDANGIDLLSKTSKYTDPDLGAQTAITKFEYNDASNPGLVTKIVPPRGNTGGTPDYSYATSFAYYNATGNPTEAGMLQSTTDPLGNKTTYTYDAVGRRLTMVDPNGNAAGGTPSAHTWTYAYDNEDRLTSASVPAPTTGGTALTTTYTYDPVGNRTVVKGANSQVTKYLYDVRDSLSEVDQSPSAWTDPNVAPSPKYVTTYSYDNLGNLSRVTRAQGDANNERATDYAYDGLNRLRKETQYPSWPATTPTLVTSYTYDGDGNRLTTVDPLNQTTTDGYDAENRLTSISYSDGTTPNVAFVFDANGNRTSMADGTGSTSYAYDETDRLLSVTSPGPKTVGYRYDLDGNRTKMIYPDSTAVTYTFDKASQLQSLLDWASRQISYQYNPDGSLKLATNFNGTTASYSYDNALRLLQVLNQKGSTTLSQHTYTLDNVGNRTQVSDNLSGVNPAATVGWDYGTGAQGWTGTAGSNSTLSFVSNDGSPAAGAIQAEITRKGKSDTNIWSIDQTWEQLGVPAGATVTSVRLSTIRERTSTWTSPGATNTWRVELRNTAGATQATLLGTQTESGLESIWSSDLSGTDQPVPTALQASNSTARLAIIASQSLANQNGADVAFRWDHVSLVITYISRNTYGYDHLYRLTNVNNGATTYSYDPVGNRLSKGSTSYTYDRADRILTAGSTGYTVNANGNVTGRGSDSFSFDQANRLKSATVSGTTSTYTYDGDGNRASKTVGGTTTNYVYDVNASLPNVLTDGTLKYVYGLGLAYTVDGSGNVQVYHTDGLGSVRAITDSSGNVIATYTTDEFGIPTQTQGTSSQPFQYTGQQRDPESGLYYLRARMYDPSIGRFLSRDPLFGNVSSPQSLNRYAYASENPVTLVDPSGTELCNEESGQSSECGGEIVGGAPPPVGPGETPPAVSKQAQDSYPSKRSVEPYEVGIYTPMKNRSRGDNLDIHHAPQGALAERLQPGYNYRQGPSIALPPEEHDDITVAQSQEAAARSQLSLQQLIEADIAHIQQYTNAPPEAVSALRKLISDVLK